MTNGNPAIILQYIVERVNDSLGACVQNLVIGKAAHIYQEFITADPDYDVPGTEQTLEL